MEYLLLAHLSLSGFAFPNECCSNNDCYEIQAADVVEQSDAWRISATGELFPKQTVRNSPDGKFYRCSAQARVDARTYCLFIPQWGS
jgi:hypothetical protein